MTDTNNSISKAVQKKIAVIQAIDAELPGIIIIHNIKDWSVVYMSQRGLQQLGITLEELQQMGPDYHSRFFNPEESEHYVPAILGMLERNNNDEVISYFQQVRPTPEHDWVWHASTSRIFMRDKKGLPFLTLTIALPINPTHHLTTKVARLLEENDFLRKHYTQFARLGKRERDVLKLIAMGKSSAEISEALFISTTTVDTHRRNIKQKLNVSTAYELSQYARAFDLI